MAAKAAARTPLRTGDVVRFRERKPKRKPRQPNAPPKPSPNHLYRVRYVLGSSVHVRGSSLQPMLWLQPLQSSLPELKQVREASLMLVARAADARAAAIRLQAHARGRRVRCPLPHPKPSKTTLVESCSKGEGSRRTRERRTRRRRARCRPGWPGWRAMGKAPDPNNRRARRLLQADVQQRRTAYLAGQSEVVNNDQLSLLEPTVPTTPSPSPSVLDAAAGVFRPREERYSCHVHAVELGLADQPVCARPSLSAVAHAFVARVHSMHFLWSRRSAQES